MSSGTRIVEVRQNVTEDQHPVVFAPEGDVPGSVAWRLDNAKRSYSVTFTQAPRHGMGRPRPQRPDRT